MANDTKRREGPTAQERAAALAEWMQKEATNTSVAGKVDTRGYVFEPGFLFRKQAI